ncbi:hypothetical protein DMH04_39530 [Kibdelosporangium aridum]|uniref:Uncharacterized protein n=1 Tax=Kibdelosporangium aridum TaxID=2030 RepID=A0A428YX25_KIBAR|nr:hypothetical protein [Kibdelosporangium aridum]RSM74554.1 hypothetical protein DMH04_39530 [Kibdelosporangium aridum]
MSTAIRALTVLTTGVLLASCSAEAPSSVTAPPPTTTTSTPVPLTQQEYQAALTATDQAMAAAVNAVQAAGTVEALQEARSALAQVAETEGSKLGELLPPTAVASAHRSLHNALSSTALATRNADVTSQPKQNSCGIAEPQLPAAKENVNASVRSRKADFTALATAGFQFGSFVPAPAPPKPAEQNRRAANGKVLLKVGPRGRGRLKIQNAAASDVAISVVTSGDPAKPQAMIYVHASSEATLTGISGTYQVYFKTGEDWDDGRKGFTRDCGYEKFDQTFDQKSDWRISLEKSTLGNASTSDVPPF